jgi:hypothetical protein
MNPKRLPQEILDKELGSKKDMFLKRLKAQSIIEYAALTLIVSAAATAMTLYIQRNINVRVRHLNLELHDGQR